MTAPAFLLATSFSPSLPAFQTTGLMHDASRILLPAGRAPEIGGRQLLEFRDGRFAALARDGKEIYFWTDDMAQDSLFFYHQNGVWGVSNSLLGLARELQARGVGLKFNPASYAAFALRNFGLFGGQLSTFQTPIHGIELLPSHRYIRIGNAFGTPAVFEVLEKPERDFTALRPVDFVNRAAGVIRSIFPLFQGAMIDLSGGFDSRLSFALSYFPLSDAGQERVRVNSNRSLEQDYALAKPIIERFGCTEGAIPGAGTEADTSRLYDLWKLGSAGVYVPMTIPRAAHLSSVLHVHGGNFRAISYAKRSAREKLELYRNRLRERGLDKAHIDAFSENFIASFEGAGSAFESPHAMQEHYLQFRARFHYGRAGFKNLSRFLITPLLSAELRGIYRHRYAPAGRRKMHMRVMNHLLMDCMRLIHADLPRFPFSRKKEDSASERVLWWFRRRLDSLLGSAESSRFAPQSFQVLNSPEFSGEPGSLPGDSSKAEIMRLLRQDLARIDPDTIRAHGLLEDFHGRAIDELQAEEFVASQLNHVSYMVGAQALIACCES